MNILLIISKNDKYGAQRLFVDQARALHQLGHQVVVVGRGTQGYIPESIADMDLEYHGITMKNFKDLLFLRRLALKNKINVIHTFLDRADYFGILLSWLTKVPVVCTMNVRRHHIGYRFADRVVTVSNVQKELLMRNCVKADRIKVIRPGIDVERYGNPVADKRVAWKGRLKIDRYSVVFCHISSIIPQKSHAVSIELVAEFKRRGEEPLLIIAGDPLQGKYYESLLKTLSESGLEQNVYFTGWTSDLPELLSLSHFTLLPSVHEAFGMVLLEGMAAGTPIVAREGEGGAELIEEYGTGFLYKPSEGVPGLADKILALWSDRDRYATFSDKCKAIVKKEFTITRFGERLVELYRSILSAG